MNPNQIPVRTKLGRKYGHPFGERHKIIANTGKSGITPLQSPYAPRDHLTAAQLLYRDDYNEYQINRCFGFTAHELEELDALHQRMRNLGRVQPCTMLEIFSIANHRFIRCSRGRNGRSGCGIISQDIRSGKEMEWALTGKQVDLKTSCKTSLTCIQARNDVVWNALEPCLRLASRFMSSAYTLSWWQAFIEGEYQPIDPTRLPARDQGITGLETFSHTGDPFDINFSARLENFLRNYNISYHLINGWDDPWTGLDRGNWMCALTTPIFLDRKRDRIEIYVSYEMLEPLLRTDLTIAESSIDRFRFVATLMHEVTVVFLSLD